MTTKLITRLPLPFFSLLLSLVLVLLVMCCGGMSINEARARSAINLITDSVDTSYALAMQGCQDLEGQIMSAGESGAQTAAATESSLARVQARCHAVRDGFEEIRRFHEQAIMYANTGQYDQALSAIEKVRESWQALAQKTGKP
jgi:hypothetical protein